jgi:predicted kinase
MLSQEVELRRKCTLGKMQRALTDGGAVVGDDVVVGQDKRSPAPRAAS